MGQSNFEAIGLKQFGEEAETLFTEVLNGSTVFDPASLATITGTTSSGITVTGAALGDFVMVSSSLDQGGVIANGYVSAANTVKITVFNTTAGTVDLASSTWKIKVLKG